MSSGLEDVVAAETVLSEVDGAGGRLTIRGRRLDDIAGASTFEEIVHLLLDGFVHDLPSVEDMPSALGAAKREVDRITAPWLGSLVGMPIYDAMRVGVAMMPDGTSVEDALRLVAAPAVLLTALLRQSAGSRPIAPDPHSSHSMDILRMLGRADGADALDAYLVTVCDHGLNASTFAARVVASTQAGLTSAVLAGLGALKGPLHGGAPGPVIDMLDAIAQERDPRRWLLRELSGGGRLMGFGHRIYRTRDPRADALKAALHRLGRDAGRLAAAEEVERIALDVLQAHKPDRVLQTNVEFYTALLLEAVGFPPDAFTGVFAMGRVAGWIAHAREQASTGRLIRPQSSYVGPVANAADRAKGGDNRGREQVQEP